MRRKLLGLSAVVIVVAIVLYGFVAYQKPVPAFAAKIPAATTTASAMNINWPAHGEIAIGAVGYGVLATHGVQKAQPTASVAKIMLALAVLKQHPLNPGEQGPILTMTQADVNLYNAYVAEDGSVAKVTVGEQISEYQALEALLLPSADNAADTLAIWSYGSIRAYSDTANSMAAGLGMNDTHFGNTDASGLAPNTVSTARDLLLLGQAAIQNPTIVQIVAQPSANIPVAGTIQNVNWLLGRDGINGIKTGNTDQAGGVYLFSAKQTFPNGQSVTTLGVIMDTSATLLSTLDEALPLLASVQSNFRLTTLVHAGQVMGTYDVPWYGMVNAVARVPLSTITWQGNVPSPSIALQDLKTPLTTGAQVGSISYKTIGTMVPIVIAKSVPSAPWHWRLTHAF